jgi:YhcH/YjgK/YiaL family protein
MIVDSLENASLYHGLGERLRKALDYLHVTDFSMLATGSHEIEGKAVYAIVNDYETQLYEAQAFEAHRKYIDVQYLAQGEELIGYTPYAGQTATREYQEEHDYALYQGEPDFIHMRQGMFAIFFPTDLHMPGMGESVAPVRKVVVKVAV